jgi:hypothetical protein
MDRKELIKSRQTQVVQATKSEALERTEGTAMRDCQLKLEERLQKRFMKAAGTDRLDLAESLIGQANLLVQRWTGTSVTRALTVALQILEEIKPGDSLQAMLAVQMVGVHFAATATLSRAGADGSADVTEILIRRATRLMHLFTQQTELMAKLKGKVSQQKVVVEHVHVNAGGKAVVGTIVPREEDNSDKE